MKAFGEAVGLLIAVAVLVWVALIYFAGPDQKAIVACLPFHELASGAQTTSAAAQSASSSSNAPNSHHVARVTDSDTGRHLPVADRIALGCLRFTDRLFNR